MKIGIDVGGTKTEGILLDPNGTEIDRKRINTEKNYDGTINGIVSIINHFEDKPVSYTHLTLPTMDSV